jgi:transforming growth factor-beta-induced protein
MQFSYLVTLALASAVQGVTLMEAIASQSTTLSTLSCMLHSKLFARTLILSALLAEQPVLMQMLMEAKNITILAPSNDAFASFVQSPENKAAAADNATLMAVLEYHVLEGMHMASAFTTKMEFFPTMLGASGNMTMGSMMMSNMSLSSVTGGQVVGGMKMGNMVEIMSGLKETSMVQTADLMFDGGVIHVIDSVLTIPKMPSVSAVDSQLTALAGALKSTNLLMAVDMLKDITIFAPSNAAFKAIGSATGSLTEQQLAGILEYHIINGTVGYSTLLSMGLANKTLPTLEGPDLRVQATGDKIFINGAQVQIADVLVSNGVMHVINA